MVPEQDCRGGTNYRDRGASTLEYVAVLTAVAVVAGVLVVTLSQARTPITTQVAWAVCTILQMDGCEPAPQADGVREPGGEPDQPVGTPIAGFFEGGVTALSESARGAACLVHMCGGEQFSESWTRVGHTAEALSPDEEMRTFCPDWGAAEGASPTRPDGSPREQQHVGTFNMYGNVGHQGRPDDIVPTVETSVNYREPTFLALQEVCESQAEELARRLDGRYEVYFDPVPARAYDSGEYVTCDNDARYGNAVLYQSEFADDIETSSHPLGTSPGGGREMRQMACVSSASKGTVFCTAHLSSHSEDDRMVEASTIRDVLDEDYAGMTILLGGDLNDPPDAETLDNLYDSRYGWRAQGGLKEVDSLGGLVSCRSGESTHGWRRGPFHWGRKKLDYIFVSNDVEIHHTETRQSGDSDHDSLWSDVTF